MTQAMSPARVALDRDGGILRIVLHGSWRRGTDTPSLAGVDAALASGVARVAFDARELTDWDTRLVSYVRSALRACEARNVPADRSALPAAVQQLLTLAAAVPETKTAAGVRPEPLLTRVGNRALAAVASVQSFSAFLGEVLIALGRLLTGRARFPSRDFLLATQDCGARALPIVALVSLLVGLILAFMDAIQLRTFGAQIFVADLVAIGMAHDMGAPPPPGTGLAARPLKSGSLASPSEPPDACAPVVDAKFRHPGRQCVGFRADPKAIRGS